MNGKIVEIITKAGGLGLAVLLAFILYKVITNDLTHIGNYMQSQTKALGSVRETMVDIRGVVEANTVQSTRTEAAINKLEVKLR